MHHVIWVEHDGSWTWSIEEGKAFEDDHKVLARDDGFPTRGDAKEDMEKAWGKLIDQGKRPGRLGDLAKAKAGKKTAGKKKSATSKSAAPKLTSVPEWGVIIDDTLVALFAKKADAEKYAKQQDADNHVVKKISLGVSV